MFARPSLTAAFRCEKALVSQQCAQLSTTNRKSVFKEIDDGRGRADRSMTNPFARLETRETGETGGTGTRSGTEALRALYNESHQGRNRRFASRKQTNQEMGESSVSQAYLQQMPRRWKVGDVYAPRDLSPYEASKWKGNSKKVRKDVVDILGLNPLDNYRNFAMISEFMTPFGRIQHSDETGLRPVNQRKMAKAIRRAIGLGLHPSVHHHPEILMMRAQTISRGTRSDEGRPVTTGVTTF